MTINTGCGYGCVFNMAAVKGNLTADTGAEPDLQNPNY